MRTEATLPFVSVVLPVRNEERHIRSCLDSILGGTYPSQRLEILIVDGCSDDGTLGILDDYCRRYPNVRMLANPDRTVPCAMNIGIRAAHGDLIVRVDAHADYECAYVSQLVTWMERLGADNVGGRVVTRPASDSPQAIAAALVLSHPFGVGGSLFRTLSGGAPVETDTVPFGCYRREVFDRIGLFDERFVRNQDDELNARLRKAGGRIYLVPEIRIDYTARDSLNKLGVMLYQYGYFKPLVAIKLGRPATLRQLAPPIFVSALLGLPLLSLVIPPAALLWCGIAAAYVAADLVVSARQSIKSGWRIFPHLFAGFILAHVSYGWGYLRGILDFGVLRRHSRNSVRDMKLSR